MTVLGSLAVATARAAGPAAPQMGVPVGLGDDLLAAAPLLLVFGGALLVMLQQALQGERALGAIVPTTGLTLLAALGAVVLLQGGAASSGFGGALSFDAWSSYVNVVLVLATALAVTLSPAYLDRVGVREGEYYALVLFSLLGMMAVALAADLLVLFVAIEVMSISMYVLAAIRRASDRSVEAGFKYFILGAFSSALLLYGIALIYGAAASTRLEALAQAVAGGGADPLLLGGVALLLAGLAFKVAAVPFHMWAPDVYQGAPTPVTAAMATGVKVASFAALGRILLVALPGLVEDWSGVLVALAGLTMLGGNLAALVQDDLKRMLAYSSIGHAGYLLMGLTGVVAGGPAHSPAVAGVLFYLLAYTFMSLGAFGVLTLMTRDGEDATHIAGLSGLARTRPWLAAGMVLCLLSLAGIPPTMGFVGKFYLFSAAVQAGHVGLAVVGGIAAAIGVYYYLRPVVYMVMRADGEPMDLPRIPAVGVVLAIASVALLVFGVAPEFVLPWCRAGLISLAG